MDRVIFLLSSARGVLPHTIGPDKGATDQAIGSTSHTNSHIKTIFKSASEIGLILYFCTKKSFMAKDIFHEHVKEALIKDGWRITHDPLKIAFKGKNIEIDLGAEPIFGAQREGKEIAVEVKSFVEKSLMYAFHKALGQFINYRRILKKTDANRTIFLAVPVDVFKDFFEHPFGKDAIEEEDLKVIVFDPMEKTIVAWIK